MKTADLVAALKKHPVIAGCCVLALALAGAIYFRSGDVPKAAEELERQSTESARLAENVRNATQLQEQFDALTSDGKQIESRLVRAGELAKNLQYFYKLSAETNAELIDLHQNTVEPPKAGKTAFFSVSFSISVRGNYQTLLAYLRRLESGERYCRVTAATVDLIGLDRNGTLKLSLSLDLLGQP